MYILNASKTVGSPLKTLLHPTMLVWQGPWHRRRHRPPRAGVVLRRRGDRGPEAQGAAAAHPGGRVKDAGGGGYQRHADGGFR